MNPFKYQKALSPPHDELVGRGAELRAVTQDLFSENHVLLCGNKTVGKTSLVNFVVDSLRSKGCLVLFVDCRGVRGVEALGEKISSACRKVEPALARRVDARDKVLRGVQQSRSLGAEKILKGSTERTTTKSEVKDSDIKFTNLLEALLSVSNATKTKTVLVFDEAQSFKIIGKQAVDVLYASFASQPGGVCLFTGSQKTLLTDVFTGNGCAFYRRITKEFLNSIEEADFKDFVEDAFKKSGKRITPPALDLLFSKVGINPQRVQQTAYMTWEFTGIAKDKKAADEDVVLAAVDHLLQEENYDFDKESTRLNNPGEIRGLIELAVAQCPLPTLNSRRWPRQAEFRDEQRSTVINNVKNMLEEGVLVQLENGEICHPDPLFAIWVQNSLATGRAGF